MPDDLWPSFSVPPQSPTIRQTLIDAGKGLTAQTEGKLELHVRTLPLERGKWAHDVFLVAESLDYKYPFFRVEERGDPFPVAVIEEAKMTAANEMELKENLRQLFHSTTTKRLVEQLLELIPGAPSAR